MTPVVSGRMTAERDAPFVVFLIGLRINRLLRPDQWWQPLMAMPAMIRELETRPELGFLGAHSWLGRTTIMLQYWDSFDKLEAYARARDQAHLPAWREFNRRVRASGAVGVWHETYLIAPGACEAIYVNMPPFGLGKVAARVSAEGARDAARQRLQRAAPG